MKKYNVGLVGYGWAATAHIPGINATTLGQVTAICSSRPLDAAELSTQYGSDITVYNDLDEMLANPAIQVVSICGYPNQHAGQTIRAAKAGKHVISEKPMATSVADCDRMISVCKAAKVKLAIGYRLHYDLYHQELMRLAREQDFGPFMKMAGDRAFVFGQRAWRIDKKLAGGGAMMDLGIYIVHGACMAANGSAPIFVTAHEEPKQKPELFNEVEETIRWSMEFRNGARCDAVTSFNHSADTFRAEGAKGWIEFKQHAFTYRGIVAETSRNPLNFAAINQQAAQMDDFADCILSGRDTSVPGELGRRDMQIITAIYEAARTGKRVKVNA